jgi:hypothetical protein
MKYNIKMDLKGTGCEAIDWINLAEDREKVTGLCECGNEPPDSIILG